MNPQTEFSQIWIVELGRNILARFLVNQVYSCKKKICFIAKLASQGTNSNLCLSVLFLFGCPIITHQPLAQVALNFDQNQRTRQNHGNIHIQHIYNIIYMLLKNVQHGTQGPAINNLNKQQNMFQTYFKKIYIYIYSCLLRYIPTFLNISECIEVLQGKITRGKENATAITNPSFKNPKKYIINIFKHYEYHFNVLFLLRG